jgi:hypothetical protein
MPLFKTIWSSKIQNPSGGKPAEISVVRQDLPDGTTSILFSIVELGAVRRRATFSLTPTQGMALAKFLAGVTSLMKIDAEYEDDDEVTPTTLPGRPLITDDE